MKRSECICNGYGFSSNGRGERVPCPAHPESPEERWRDDVNRQRHSVTPHKSDDPHYIYSGGWISIPPWRR